ncbi:hypothetical protein GCM10009091_32680 [Pseudomonas brenneri]|nr:hypothetical protein GCM10009091_32680 [Pseudomonas brenneri]
MGIGQECMPDPGGDHHALARIDLAATSIDLNLHTTGLGQDYLMKVVFVKLDLTRIGAQSQREWLGGRSVHPSLSIIRGAYLTSTVIPGTSLLTVAITFG